MSRPATASAPDPNVTTVATAAAAQPSPADVGHRAVGTAVTGLSTRRRLTHPRSTLLVPLSRDGCPDLPGIIEESGRKRNTAASCRRWPRAHLDRVNPRPIDLVHDERGWRGDAQASAWPGGPPGRRARDRAGGRGPRPERGW